MRPTSALVLAVFLIAVTLLTGKRIKEDKGKAGLCPRDNKFCYRSDMSRCQRDKHCTGRKKCCYVECGFRCVIPRKKSRAEKAFQERLHGRSENYPPIGVRHKVKRKAKSKHYIPEVYKRGICPIIPTQCTVLDPPKLCQRDSDCPGAKKCCTSYCGLSCFEPQ